MRFQTYLSIFLFLFVFSSTSFSQTCLPEGIIFTTQNELDNFLIDYPNCTAIEGDLTIDGEDISSLLPLSNITSIEGDLAIGYNYSSYSSSGSPLLTSLAGLENLVSVGGWLDIEICTELINLTGLEGITSVGEGLIIVYNQSLTSLSGLEGLTNLDGPLFILLNFELTSIDALSSVDQNGITNLAIYRNTLLSICNISSVCSYLENPNGIVKIYDNGDGCATPTQIAESCSITLPCLPFGDYYFLSQNDIDDFPTNYPTCFELNGQIHIKNQNITDLFNLSQITSINGDLLISFAPNLSSLEGLHNLDFISGALSIKSNSNLTDISALSTIISDSLNNLMIYNNSSLSACSITSICNYLNPINGSLTIYNNNEGCNTPAQIADSCDVILDCHPLGDYYFLSQQEIDDFPTNYPGCTELMGYVKINGEDIANLDGLSQITSISGRLDILSNPMLNDISGLSNLTFIGENFFINSNDVLEDLSPLENLTLVNKGVYIYGNSILESLTGLDNINSDSLDYIRVNYNPSLSMCSILSLCNYLEIDSAQYEIANNLDNCNSAEEVAQLCINEILEYSDLAVFNIYPNPSSNIVSIVSDNNIIIDEISIFNQLGQVILHQNGYAGSIDISKLDSGNYIIEITSNNSKERKIFIVQK